MPRLYIISGPNGSGKTTASYAVLPELLDCSEYVNSDEFAKHASPFAPEAAAITASRLMIRKSNYLFSRREDFCIETTLATRSLIKMVKSAREMGYYVTVIYFWLRSPDLAVQRVANRVKAGGHDVPEETIRRRYIVGLKYFFDTYMPECDKWILADNSEPPFQIIAEGSKKGLVISNIQKYQRIRQMAGKSEEPQQRALQTVKEEIIGELAKVHLAHDGVPFENTAQ